MNLFVSINLIFKESNKNFPNDMFHYANLYNHKLSKFRIVLKMSRRFQSENLKLFHQCILMIIKKLVSNLKNKEEI